MYKVILVTFYKGEIVTFYNVILTPLYNLKFSSMCWHTERWLVALKLQDYLYHYKAILSRVIDGDTIVFKEIDMGLDVVVKRKRARLLGINTPELHAKDAGVRAKANEAKVYLENRLQEDTNVIIKIRDYDPFDSFGRILADIYLEEELLNKTMLTLGFAVEFEK